MAYPFLFGRRRRKTKELIIDNEKSGIPSLPCTPFLLTSVMKKGGNRQFVITEVEGADIEPSEEGHFVQTFKWAGHEASEEEVKTFLREDEG